MMQFSGRYLNAKFTQTFLRWLFNVSTMNFRNNMSRLNRKDLTPIYVQWFFLQQHEYNIITNAKLKVNTKYNYTLQYNTTITVHVLYGYAYHLHNNYISSSISYCESAREAK